MPIRSCLPTEDSNLALNQIQQNQSKLHLHREIIVLLTKHLKPEHYTVNRSSVELTILLLNNCIANVGKKLSKNKVPKIKISKKKVISLINTLNEWLTADKVNYSSLFMYRAKALI